MAFTYDPTTDAGKVRLLITDTRSDMQQFADAEIDTFLALAGTVRLAAAMALEVLAANEALVQKRIDTMRIKTDGSVIARELRELAASLRQQEEAYGSLGFEVAEQAGSVFGEMQILTNQIQRGAF